MDALQVKLLADTLKGAGLPIAGICEVSEQPTGSGFSCHTKDKMTIRLDWRSEPSEEHVAQAQSLIASMDLRPRRRRDKVAVYRDVLDLPVQDRNRLMAAVIADYLVNHPGVAVAAGINLRGDEPQ